MQNDHTEDLFHAEKAAKRPYVNLKSHNTVNEMLTALHEALHKFTALNGVVGIILDGGLSRGYGDSLSEIDVVIYLREKQFIEYKEGVCPFSLGISMMDGHLYDITVLIRRGNNFMKPAKKWASASP